MTERKDFKKIVRDRMKEMGANYTAARASLSPGDAASAATARSFTSVDDLLSAAFAEAERLRHGAVGPEHGLLALLNGKDDPARRALTQAGLSVDLVEAVLGTLWEATAERDGVVTNHAWHQIAGRAEGLGFAGGSVSTNFVIAVLWDARRWSLWQTLVPREAVVAALQREGVVTPSNPLPALDRADQFTQQVTVPMEHLKRVVHELARLHEEGGPRIAFNHDGETGWVMSEPGIDLQAVVDGIIAADA